MSTLSGKAVVLVVTGGIAAYKSAELARMYIREGAEVRVAMTQSATRFITPLTFQTLTNAPVTDDLWSENRPWEISHIALADRAQAVVIAPATANIIGKMASGIADDFVSTFLMAVRAPILICPAMNVNMYDHPIQQANLKKLRDMIQARIVEPASGQLACGWEGRGRLAPLDVIVEETKSLLTPQDLAGFRVMVTAGPTREPWDGIRFLSNRSTGLMGYALARVARRRGAEVLLVTGPVNAEPPFGVETIAVESTRQMREAVLANIDGVRVLVKAAAPSDFRPARCVSGKIKKTELPPPIELESNPDILAEIGANKGRTFLVGFAAESEHLLERAAGKLKAKNLDLIVANQIGPPDESFGAATNRVWIIDAQGQVDEIPLLAKEEVAARIWDRVVSLVKLTDAG